MPHLYTDTSLAPAVADDAARYRKGLRRAMGRIFAAHPDASLTSLMVLLSLPHKGKLSLADKLGINAATVASHITRLTGWGYVRVQCAQRLADTQLITLTPEGEALFQL